MSAVYDMPEGSGGGLTPILLDANANVYPTLPNGGGLVFVERYAVRKILYSPLAIDTENDIRTETYLVKETNLTDIGGGWYVFERHYAQVPETWFDYQQVSYSLGPVALNTVVINPPSASVRQKSILAKATRTYYRESDLPALTTEPPSVTLTIGECTADNQIIASDKMQIHLGKIYEVTTFTAQICTG